MGPLSDVGGSSVALLQVQTVWATAGERSAGCESSMKAELKDSQGAEPPGHHSWGTSGG